jgi:hypothetical protein
LLSEITTISIFQILRRVYRVDLKIVSVEHPESGFHRGLQAKELFTIEDAVQRGEEAVLSEAADP